MVTLNLFAFVPLMIAVTPSEIISTEGIVLSMTVSSIILTDIDAIAWFPDISVAVTVILCVPLVNAAWNDQFPVLGSSVAALVDPPFIDTTTEVMPLTSDAVPFSITFVVVSVALFAGDTMLITGAVVSITKDVVTIAVLLVRSVKAA